MFANDFVEVEGPIERAVAWLSLNTDDVSTAASRGWQQALTLPRAPASLVEPIEVVVGAPRHATDSVRFGLDWIASAQDNPVRLMGGDLVVQALETNRTHLEAQCSYPQPPGLAVVDHHRRAMLYCLRYFLGHLALDLGTASPPRL